MATERFSSASSSSSNVGVRVSVTHRGEPQGSPLRCLWRLSGALALVALLVASAPMTARAPIAVRFLTYDDVRALPGVDKLDALTRVPVAQRPAAWDAWVRQRAVDVNRRLQQGEEDSLAYLLLYGTSFTTAPRVTREFLEGAATCRIRGDKVFGHSCAPHL